MGEKMLRFIITEVNKMHGTDYNMISFDSLPKNTLLQIMADCLQKLDAFTKVDVDRNTEDSVAKLLEVLANIKTPFPPGVSINEFTDGIIQGKRTIVHPTLHWILSNQKEVAKRAYFSKYLKKITPPLNIMSDPEVQSLITQYENLIQEFKNIHAENSKYAKIGQATLDLRKDIEKISNDIKKVILQIEKQKSKVGNIPTKESLFVSIKAYRSEVLQEKMLKNQLEEQKNFLTEIENDIKKTDEYLRKQQSLRLSSGDMIEKLKEEVQTNRVIAKERLPQEYEMIKSQAQLIETVASEPEPTDEDITELQNMIDNSSLELQQVMDKVLLTNDPKHDKLAQFRQHAIAISNNKQLTADALMELKEELDNARQQVNDKEQELQRTIGGSMLQGEDLKLFVLKLRSRSVVFKEHRLQLQELQAEIGVLERTLDILLKENISLEEALQSRNENGTNEPADESLTSHDKQELVKMCKQLIRNINTQKTETSIIKQELRNVKVINEEISGTHQHVKEIFDSSMSNFNNKISKLNSRVNELEKLIEEEENKWKELIRQTERKKDSLIKMAQEIKQTDGTTKTQKDVMNEKVAEEQVNKEKLDDEMKSVLGDKENREQQTVLWNSVLEILKCKQEHQEN